MNHNYPPPRGMVPPGPSQRLNELLDQIRAEFETESQRSVDYESQSEYCLMLPSQAELFAPIFSTIPCVPDEGIQSLSDTTSAAYSSMSFGIR